MIRNDAMHHDPHESYPAPYGLAEVYLVDLFPAESQPEAAALQLVTPDYPDFHAVSLSSMRKKRSVPVPRVWLSNTLSALLMMSRCSLGIDFCDSAGYLVLI